MSSSVDPRELFAEYATGEIAGERLAALENALRGDARLRLDFIEYMNVDSALGDMAALTDDDVSAIEAGTAEDAGPAPTQLADSGARPDVGKGRVRRPAALVGSVVAVALLAVTLTWFADPLRSDGTPVARLVSAIDAEISFEGEPFIGTHVERGGYELSEGLMELRFGNGVTVYVEAPTRFDVVGHERILLRSGRLSATVPPEGVGFTVETPEAEVVDLGTEFSVDVEDGTSEIHVFDGLVQVQSTTRDDGGETSRVDVRTSEAVRFEGESSQPVDIAIDHDRFVRTFEEPRLGYWSVANALSPVAHYRMSIRRGLLCRPPRYSGELLKGEGRRPPTGPGFRGGALRVRADSSSRGARVSVPPPLDTGRFTLSVAVYARSRVPRAVVATNIEGADGCFTLSLDDEGRLMAVVRTLEGELVECSGRSAIPLAEWVHVVVTVDGDRLRLFENGSETGTAGCPEMAPGREATMWFGTDASATALWDGRIDELSLFDRALSVESIAKLYESARNQVDRSDGRPSREE